MVQFLGWGGGGDGAVPASGTYGGTNSTCSGTAASTTLNKSSTFTVGDIVLIHQSRGTGVGQWELNQVATDGGGATLTLVNPLAYTYTDSGASQAQIIEVKEYTGGTISATLTASAWNENVGGILPLLVNGDLVVTGTIDMNALGYQGGNSELGGLNSIAGQGDGTTAAPAASNSANGSGGGGGDQKVGNGVDAAGGGGAGHVNAGSAGEDGGEAGVDKGLGGSGSIGSADLITAVFGGGGGAGGNQNNSTDGWNSGGEGGAGGGFLLIFAKSVDLSGATIVRSNGANGSAQSGGGSNGAGGSGGGGAGGSIFIKAITANIGTNKVECAAGTGNTFARNGGDGSIGRIRVEACSITGSVATGSYSSSAGGFDFCASANQIL